MAKIVYSGFDNLIKGLEQAGKNVDPACRKAVKAGAEYLAERLREAAPVYNGPRKDVERGALRKGIKTGTPVSSYTLGYYSKVYITGEQHGLANGEIAFIVEFGDSRRAPHPWWVPTVERYKLNAIQRVKETFLEEMKK